VISSKKSAMSWRGLENAYISFFVIAYVPVITLAGLIVVAQDTYAVDYKSQPIFEDMLASRNRLWHMPNDDVGEGVFGNIDSAADQFLRFHSDHDGYAPVCCQSIQHMTGYTDFNVTIARSDFAHSSPETATS